MSLSGCAFCCWRSQFWSNLLNWMLRIFKRGKRHDGLWISYFCITCLFVCSTQLPCLSEAHLRWWRSHLNGSSTRESLLHYLLVLMRNRKRFIASHIALIRGKRMLNLLGCLTSKLHAMVFFVWVTCRNWASKEISRCTCNMEIIFYGQVCDGVTCDVWWCRTMNVDVSFVHF